jgi:hypothetical protein
MTGDVPARKSGFSESESAAQDGPLATDSSSIVAPVGKGSGAPTSHRRMGPRLHFYRRPQVLTEVLTPSGKLALP